MSEKFVDLIANPTEESIVPLAEFDQALKEQEFNQPLTAGALGAARGLTFGLSDVIGRQVGGRKYTQYAKALEEVNPVASTTGEIGGAVGGLFVPIGLPAQLAKGSAAAARAAIPVAETFGSRLAQTAVAGGIEGGVYGLGQTMSEQALGTPESVAESLIANVGMGAILGGVFNVGGELAVSGISSSSNKIKNILKGDDPLAKWMNGDDLDNFVQAELKIAGREDVLKSAQELGIELTPGMKSGSEIIQGLESSLGQSPSIPGTLVKRNINKTQKGIQREASKIFEEATEETSDVVGEQVKKAVITKLTDDIEPIKQTFNRLNKDAENILVDEKLLTRLVNNIDGYANKNLLQDNSSIKSVLKDLDSGNIKSVKEVQLVRSKLNDEMSAAWRSGKTNEYRILAEVKNKITNFEEKTVQREAINLIQQADPTNNEFKKLFNLEEGKDVAKQVIGEFRKARSEYREFMELLEDIGKQGKLGKIRNLTDFIDKLDEMDSKQITEKLFNTKNLKAMRFFKDQFPEQFEQLRRLELQKIRNNVMAKDPIQGEIFRTSEVAKIAKKYEPEVLAMIFDDVRVKNLKNLENVISATPRKIGPSGTPEGIDYQNMLNPLLLARDSARYMAYRGLRVFAKAKDKQSSFIFDKAKEFFGKAAKAAKIGTTVGIISASQKKYEERLDEVENLVNNPDEYVKRIEENTKGLAELDPSLQVAVAAKANQAAQFLKSKAPQNPYKADLFFNKKNWKPSDFEMSMFNRYLQVVDDPYSVLDDMNANVMTKESVDTLRTIYPEIYNNIIKQYSEMATEINDDIDFAKKSQLAMLFGSPVATIQDQGFVQALQASAMSAPNQQNDQAGGGTRPRKFNTQKATQTMGASEKLLSSRGG